eukprot:gene8006-biopygen18096
MGLGILSHWLEEESILADNHLFSRHPTNGTVPGTCSDSHRWRREALSPCRSSRKPPLLQLLRGSGRSVPPTPPPDKVPAANVVAAGSRHFCSYLAVAAEVSLHPPHPGKVPAVTVAAAGTAACAGNTCRRRAPPVTRSGQLLPPATGSGRNPWRCEALSGPGRCLCRRQQPSPHPSRYTQRTAAATGDGQRPQPLALRGAQWPGTLPVPATTAVAAPLPLHAADSCCHRR